MVYMTSECRAVQFASLIGLRFDSSHLYTEHSRASNSKTYLIKVLKYRFLTEYFNKIRIGRIAIGLRAWRQRLRSKSRLGDRSLAVVATTEGYHQLLCTYKKQPAVFDAAATYPCVIPPNAWK